MLVLQALGNVMLPGPIASTASLPTDTLCCLGISDIISEIQTAEQACPPEHEPCATPPADAVVVPMLHCVQLAAAPVGLPPGEKVPFPHCAQSGLAPAYPGKQPAGQPRLHGQQGSCK